MSAACVRNCIIADQTLSLYTTLWGGPVSVDLFLGKKKNSHKLLSASRSSVILLSIITNLQKLQNSYRALDSGMAPVHACWGSIQKEVISDLKDENQFLLKEIWESI